MYHWPQARRLPEISGAPARRRFGGRKYKLVLKGDQQFSK